jgi:cardiolipin synthase
MLYIADLAIRIGLSIRILMRGKSVGVTFAWMTIVLALPYLGALIYLLIGENRLGEQRIARARKVIEHSRQWQDTLCRLASHKPPDISRRHLPLNLQAKNIIGYPTLPGNRLTLLTDFTTIFRSIIDDIKSAQTSCRLEFYIWAAGGLADELLDAVIDAHKRGVECKILLDSMGSKEFLKGKSCRKLRTAGINVTEALHVSPVRMLFQRADIRNHRKIAVIDNHVAYTGSQNLVDPRYFKQDAGVGEWIDAMIRIEGPSVAVLDNVAAVDWSVEAKEAHSFSTETITMEGPGDTHVQVVPSGPVFREGAIHQLLMSVVYMARHELIITTPYFAPDEPLMGALIAAANRGVDVTLIIPARVDSLMVRYATPALLDSLITAGIKVAQFEKGLLHTKSITVDDNFCIVGSVNMDMRSLWLNFEISLFIYGADFCSKVREVQNHYLEQSVYIDPDSFSQRTLPQRMATYIMRLFAPLL